MELTDDNLRELFQLFTSVSRYERKQIYEPESLEHFSKVRLEEEYELHEAKKEYACDAWRAVVFFLHARGYRLLDDKGREHTLDFVENLFFE
jgi:hypothetical protein